MPTDVSAPLPQLDTRDGTIFTVDTGDPNVIVVELAVHGWTENPQPAEEEPSPILAHLPVGSNGVEV